MQLYKVKLNEGHKAQPDQVTNGYLGYAGDLELYTRGEALKKAIAFNGKIEKHGKNYTVNELKVIQLAKQELSPAVQRELEGREVYTEAYDDTAIPAEPIYYGDVFAGILGEETEKPKRLQVHGESLIDELLVLDNICANYQYVMVM